MFILLFYLSEMQSLKDLPKGPYPRPLRLMVVATNQLTYGEDKRMLHIAVADSQNVVKAVCFDDTKFSFFTEGSGVVLRNVISRNGEIIVTKQTQVFKTSPPAVDDWIITQGKNIISPPNPTMVTLNEAKTSPSKQRVSVQGKVINVSILDCFIM